MLRLTLLVVLSACVAAPAVRVAAKTDGDLCRDGHGGTCFALAVSTQQAGERVEDSLRVLSLFEAACNAGEALGCVEAGWMRAQPDGVAPSKDKALLAYERGCKLGAGRACTGAAAFYEHDSRTAAQAKALYLQGCNSGDSKGCGRLARLAGNVTASIPLYQRACDGNFASACDDLGRVYQRALDLVRARALFQRACDLGDPNGCRNLNGLLRAAAPPLASVTSR